MVMNDYMFITKLYNAARKYKYTVLHMDCLLL